MLDRSVLARTPYPCAVVDEAGRLIDINWHACQLLARTRPALLGTVLDDLLGSELAVCLFPLRENGMSLALFDRPGLGVPPADEVLQAVPDGILVITPDGSIGSVNPAVNRLFGFPGEELIGQPLEILIPEALRAHHRGHRQRLNQPVARAMGSGRPYPVRRRDGSTFLADIQLTGLPTPHGEAVLVVLRDVTDRIEAETALRVGEERFRLMADHINEVFWMYGAAIDRPAYINRAFESLWGRRVEEVLREPALLVEAIHPDDRHRVLAALAQHHAGANQTEVEYRIRRPDGSERHIWDRGFAVRDDAGRLVSLVGVATDITERKEAERLLRQAHDELEVHIRERTAQLAQTVESLFVQVRQRQRAEEALRASEQRYRCVLAALEDAVVLLDDQGNFLAANASAGRLLGCSEADLLGRNIDDLSVHVITESGVALAGRDLLCLDTLQAGQGCSGRLVGLRGSDGGVTWLSINAQPVAEAGAAATGLVVSLRNVTAYRESEAAVLRHQAELAHVLRYSTLGEMAAGLAHELNQPLSIIANFCRGAVRRLHAGTFAVAELVEVMEQAAVQAERASAMIQRMRNFVRKRQTHRSTADINRLVHDTLVLLEPEMRAAQVELKLPLQPDLPTLCLDTIQIQQVLLNLLRNALEAMHDQPPTRRILTVRTRLAGSIIEVEVEDTGSGVAPEVASQLFAPFVTSKPGGLGLGLAISRSILTSHGGTIETVAAAEVGTIFRFRLPLEPGEPPGDSNPSSPPAFAEPRHGD